MITPIFKIQVEGGNIKFLNKVNDYCKNLRDGEYNLKIWKKVSHRTDAQNRALHLWFTQLAEALNEAGFDMKKTLRQDVDIPWTLTSIKESLWRPVQKSYTGKKSTTDLNKQKEIDDIYDIINRTIGERTGVYVPFPSMDLSEEYYNKTIL